MSNEALIGTQTMLEADICIHNCRISETEYGLSISEHVSFTLLGSQLFGTDPAGNPGDHAEYRSHFDKTGSQYESLTWE